MVNPPLRVKADLFIGAKDRIDRTECRKIRLRPDPALDLRTLPDDRFLGAAVVTGTGRIFWIAERRGFAFCQR